METVTDFSGWVHTKDKLFKQCDIIVVFGKNPFAKMIRKITNSGATHVALVICDGDFSDNYEQPAVIVEATIPKSRIILMYKALEGKKYTVARPLNLTEEEVATICDTAVNYQGRTYGFFKLVPHLLDGILPKNPYFFRRLLMIDNYPICSWLLSFSFAKVNKYFGVSPGQATPGDIYNFIIKNPDKYKIIIDKKE